MSAIRHAPTRRVAAAAVTACAIASLAGPAFAASSAAASTVTPAISTGPSVPMATGNFAAPGEPQSIAVIPKNGSTPGTFWIASAPGGVESASHATEVNESTEAITDFTPPNGVIGIATDPSRGLAWVLSSTSVNGGSQALTEINQASATKTTVSLSSITPHLEGLAVDPSTGKVFVVDFNGDVYAVSETSPSAPSSPLVTGPGASAAVDGIAVDSSSGHIWVISQSNETASAFTQSGTSVGSAVHLGHQPAAIAVDPTANEVWVGSSDGVASEFSDASPGTPKTVSTGGSAVSISIDSGHAQVWIATSGGTLDQISEGSSPSRLASYTPTQGSIASAAIDPASGQVWSIVGTDGAQQDNVFPLVPSIPKITSGTSTWFATNPTNPNSFQFASTGFPAPAWSETGTLPKGVQLNAATGLLTGKPASTGTVHLEVTAKNTLGTSKAQSFTLNVGSLPVWTTGKSFTFYTGRAAHTAVHATGKPAPSYVGIELPAGLTLSATGEFSGKPTKTVSKATAVLVADNVVGQTPLEVTITVLKGVAAKITSAGKVSFKLGKKASFTIKATGAPAPTLALKSGKLPAGLSFKSGKSGTATITGTVRKSDKKGKYRVTIDASNGVGKAATQVITITIS
jgi:DNA-binding beta-propeller fold protein YncE